MAAISGRVPKTPRYLVLLLALSVGASGGAAADPQQQCRRVAVAGPGGHMVGGIEDVAVDHRRQRLILSAYDRFAAMDAVKAGDTPPPGALYAVPISEVLDESAATVTARALGLRGADNIPLYPHGIGLYDGGTVQRLAVVNRLPGYHDRSAADILLMEFAGDELILAGRAQGDMFCRANDVALADRDTVLFTFDQSRCNDIGIWFERAVQPHRSGLGKVLFHADGRMDTETLVEDAGFANGVDIDRVSGDVLMTASRESQLRRYSLAGLLAGDLAHGVVTMDGGPDNVSVTPDGDVALAVHPSPFDLFLYMRRLGPLPASRIFVQRAGRDGPLLIDPQADEVPGAATSANLLGDKVIVSSAWDAGLGICSIGQVGEKAGRWAGGQNR